MLRSRFHKPSCARVAGFEDQARLWSLRLLNEAVEHRRGRRHVDADALAALLDTDSEALAKLSQTTIRQRLKRRLQESEEPPPVCSGTLAQNLARLAAQLDLTPAETEVLTFAVLMKNHKLLHDCAEQPGDLSDAELVPVLSAVLDLDVADLQSALHRDGTLRASGLLEVQAGECQALPYKLEPLKGLGSALLTGHEDVAAMLSAYFRPGAPPEVDLKDYPHLAPRLVLLQRFLRRAMARGLAGVNVLVYGRPGTGKTQLVRALAQALGVPLYEVASEDEDGDGTEGKDRFRAYKLCQRLLARHPRQLILFDEVEDVFPDTLFPWLVPPKQSGRTKGWVNRLLESNPVPAFWLSNAVRQIDPAFVRRFDYVLEVPVPPQAVRERMLTTAVGDLGVSPAWIEHAAACEHLTPADVSRAVRVASLMLLDVRAPEGPPGGATVEQALDEVLRGHFELRGQPWKGRGMTPMTLPYDLKYCHVSLDLERLAQGLTQRQGGRLCLYGPPGTGKTAFARHLAERLDRPLIERRASDLLDMYVGQTEAKIAAMFREAAAERGLLLLDEADSFLRSRAGAYHSWEVTQVNELLKQMEDFEGLFICATNLMEALDEAVLRRFDLKVEYRYLTAGQARELFLATLARHGASVCGIETALRRLERLENLTPGDFATVVRKAALLGEPVEAEALITGLEAECAAKPDGKRRPIGFAG